MHIAASDPLAIDKDGIDKNIVDKELEIIKAEILIQENHQKWQKKFLRVKLIKFLNDNSLLNQMWIMDPKKKVSEILKKILQKKLPLRFCTSYKVGEGF